MKILAKEILKVVRIKEGFTTVTLAKEVGVTKQAIGRVEQRKNGISPIKAKRIVEVLGVEFDDVFEIAD